MNIKILILIIFFTGVTTYSQVENEKTLAQIGDKRISKEEFIKRYEMMPQLNRGKRFNEDANELKKDFLFSLIAEKLWANEAEALGYDTSAAVSFSYKNLEKMYVRDALFKIEITDKAKIKNEDIEKALDRINKLLKVNYLYSRDKEEIFDVYEKLKNGAPFDSVLSSRTETILQPEPYDIVYGQMEELVEDSIFALSIGEYTSPIQSPDGFYIFKLIGEGKNPEAGKENFQSAINKIIEQRVKKRIGEKFYSEFFADKEVTTDGDLFWSLSEKLFKQMKKLEEEANYDEGENIVLTDEAFYKILNDFGSDSSNMAFVKFEEEPVSLKEFLYSFIFEGFSSKNITPRIIRAQLDARVRNFIEQTLFAREGYKRGLNKLPEVREELDMWKDHYLSVQLKKDFLDSISVSDEELFEYLHGSDSSDLASTKINIIELVNNDLGIIEKVLYELERGADIKILAESFSQSDLDTGYVNAAEKGEVGLIASRLNEGEVYGPIETEEGYSIFKLIDKKEEKKNIESEALESEAAIKKKIEFVKFKDMIKSRTAELADKYGVNVNISSLNSINVTNLSMLVFRYFGFGGKTIAVPMTLEFSDWVEEWESAEEILP